MHDGPAQLQGALNSLHYLDTYIRHLVLCFEKLFGKKVLHLCRKINNSKYHILKLDIFATFIIPTVLGDVGLQP